MTGIGTLIYLILFETFLKLVEAVPPHVVPFRLPESLEIDQRLVVTCAVSKGSLPIAISWRKDGSPVVPNELLRVVHVDDYQETLQILKLGSEHVGNYTCAAKNAFGSDQMSVAVVLNFKPRWRKVGEGNQVVSGVAGESAELDCSTVAHPKPDLRVYRGELTLAIQ